MRSIKIAPDIAGLVDGKEDYVIANKDGMKICGKVVYFIYVLLVSLKFMAFGGEFT